MYDDFLSDVRWREDWVSFDGVVFHSPSNLVFCGITSFAGDIFKAYDREKDAFIDLGFSTVGDRYDAKFHRSMELARNGAVLYMATALLHDIDRYWEAPGGGIFAYGVSENRVEKLGIPVPHNYIQSICLDEKRGLIYCLHLTPEVLSVFDLAYWDREDDWSHRQWLGPRAGGEPYIWTRATGSGPVGTSRVPGRDRPGGDSNRLCRYDPDLGRIEYLSEGLPLPDGAHGYAPVEGLFNLGTGTLFASGANGSLYQVDPDTGKAEYLGTPVKDTPSRLTSLARHNDGYAYGVTGRQGNCRLLRFDPNGPCV